jgi:hypothetical protein
MRERLGALAPWREIFFRPLVCVSSRDHATWICAFTQSGGIFSAKLNAFTLS